MFLVEFQENGTILMRFILNGQFNDFILNNMSDIYSVQETLKTCRENCTSEQVFYNLQGLIDTLNSSTEKFRHFHFVHGCGNSGLTSPAEFATFLAGYFGC